MRLLTTNLTFKEVQPKLKELVDTLFKIVPAGVGAKGFVKVNKEQFKEIVEQGSKWCVENDYGWKEDLERTEGYGKIDWADASKVSDKAISRGINQMGTLGSGNHYLEIQKVEEHNIVDKNLAKKFGIFPEQIVVMVHCLPGESKVMTEHGAWIRIKDLKNKNIKVKCFDSKSHRLIDSEIEEFYEIPNKEKLYKIKTNSGKEIFATEDHPFLTPAGLKFVKELKEEQEIAISPFEGVNYEKLNNDILVDEKSIKKIYNSNKIIEELRKIDLIPIKYDSWQLPILTKLLGYITGDGHIRRIERGYRIYVGGQEEDLKEIKKDLEKLKIKSTNVKFRITYGKIKNYKGEEIEAKGESYYIEINSTPLATLLVALGCPKGKKTIKKYYVPSWIFKSPLWIKRLYLAGYFGAEMTKPIVYEQYHGTIIERPTLAVYKIEKLKDCGVKYVSQLRILLKDLDIETNKIHFEKGRITQAGKTVKIVLRISSHIENLIKFFSKVGYEYCIEKKVRASHVNFYLFNKQNLIKKEAEELNLNYKSIKFLEFKKRIFEYPLKLSLFIQNRIFNPPSEIVLDKIISIEEVENNENFVYDIRIKNDNHNFIADGFVVGNCGSRGFGHEIATNYLQTFDKIMPKYGIKIRDRELSCAPFHTKEGQDYYKAMACAANMAFVNRQVILHRIREGFSKVFKKTPEELEMNLVYDVAHNIAKLEEHKVDGKKKKLIVHRKGSTRAFPPGYEELNTLYKDIGQPVIIGGSMETGSFLLVGTKGAMDNTFGTTCFTGETKIITDKGIMELNEVYNRFNNGENFLVPSLNENNLEIEWEPILDTIKRDAEVIEVSISQKGKITQNRLRTTKDHKFITLEGGNIVYKEINNIIKGKEGVILLDKINSFLESDVKDEKAYLVGSIMSDGNFRENGKIHSVTFTQKKLDEKVNFIEHVIKCFKETYNVELLDRGIKSSSGFIRGKQVIGYANDFVCYNKIPSQDLKNIYENLDSWVLSLNKSATINFLAGMIDGDGTWNKKRGVLEIFNGDKKIVGSIVLACLKLGFLPYVSKQRKSCYIIQISEKEDLLFNYTKRVKGIVKEKIYGAKLYLAKQLFADIKKLKWPFLHKSLRNNLMSDKVIAEHIHKYPKYEEKIRKLINSPLRMQRTDYVSDLGKKEVYNITVENNHNYFVLTDMFIPVLVKNCHGSGRTMSRTQARHEVRGDKLQKDMETKGIYVRTVSMSGLAEEAGVAYKDINEVVKTVELAGISKPVVGLKPIGNVKG